MEKVLVTGAGGYIGAHVVKVLLDLGYCVVATDLRLGETDERAQAVEKDLFAQQDPYTAFGEPDALIHLAWRDGFVHNSKAHMEDLPRHYAFLSEMMKGGVKKVSVMGSMHEIGYYEGMVKEDTPTHPSNLYGIAKNALRDALAIACKETGASVRWLRGFYICGDDSRNHSIFAKILEKAERGEQSFPFTTGEARFDFIGVDDLAFQIALASVGETEGIINCCTGRAISLKDKVEQFLAEKKLSIRPEYGAFPERPYDSKIIYGDNTKMKEILSRVVEEGGAGAQRAKDILTRMA